MAYQYQISRLQDYLTHRSEHAEEGFLNSLLPEHAMRALRPFGVVYSRKNTDGRTEMRIRAFPDSELSAYGWDPAIRSPGVGVMRRAVACRSFTNAKTVQLAVLAAIIDIQELEHNAADCANAAYGSYMERLVEPSPSPDAIGSSVRAHFCNVSRMLLAENKDDTYALKSAISRAVEEAINKAIVTKSQPVRLEDKYSQPLSKRRFAGLVGVDASVLSRKNRDHWLKAEFEKGAFAKTGLGVFELSTLLKVVHSAHDGIPSRRRMISDVSDLKRLIRIGPDKYFVGKEIT